MNTNKIYYKEIICLYKMLHVSTPINYFTLHSFVRDNDPYSSKHAAFYK